MKSVKKNYIYSLMYQLLAIIAPLITAPYVSRVLSVSDIGVYSYTQSIVNNFILFGTIGLTVYGQREIASTTTNSDTLKRDECFSELLYLRIMLMGCACVMYSYFCIHKGNYSVVYSIEILQLLSAMFDIVFLFQGMEEFKSIAIRNTIVKILNVVLIFLLVRETNGLSWYVSCCAIGTVVNCIIIWLCKPKDVRLIRVPFKQIIRHFIPALTLFIPQVAVEIYTVLDKTMLGIMTVKVESGYYEQASKIVKILLTIVTSLGTVMLSRISKLLAQNNQSKIKEYIYKSFQFVYCVSIPIAVGLALVSHAFIPFYFGKGYERSADLVVILCPISVFIGMSSVCGTEYLIPSKRQKDYTINVTTGAVVNLIVNLVMIPLWGCIGAAIASVIAELSVLVRHLYSIRKDFSVFYILKLSLKYIIAAFIMSIVVIIMKAFSISTIIAMCLQVLLGATAYIITLFILKDEIVWSVFNTIKVKIKRSI